MAARHRSHSPISPIGSCSFDHLVRLLGLTPEQYQGSAELKDWVRRNKEYKYVPSELLAAWGFKVEAVMFPKNTRIRAA